MSCTLDYHLSEAVAVGFIALAGAEAETGMVMPIYLNHARQAARARCTAENRRPTIRNGEESVLCSTAMLRSSPISADLRASVMGGAVDNQGMTAIAP